MSVLWRANHRQQEIHTLASEALTPRRWVPRPSNLRVGVSHVNVSAESPRVSVHENLYSLTLQGSLSMSVPNRDHRPVDVICPTALPCEKVRTANRDRKRSKSSPLPLAGTR